MKLYIKPTLFIKIISIVLLSSIATLVITSILYIDVSKKIYIERFSDSNSQIINHLSQVLEEFSEDTYSIIDFYSKSRDLKLLFTDEYDNSKEQASLYYRIYSSINSNPTIRKFNNFNVVAIGTNDIYISDNRGGISISVDAVKNLDLYQEYKQEPQSIRYLYTDKSFFGQNTKKPAIVITRELKDIIKKQYFGDIFINIPEYEFKEFYKPYTSRDNDIAIIKEDGLIVSSSLDKLVGTYNTQLLDIVHMIQNDNLDYYTGQFNNKNYTFNASYVPTMRYYITSIVNNSYILDNYEEYRYKILKVNIGLFMITSILLFIISHQITKPIEALVKTISMAKQKDFKNYASPKGSYEVRVLADTYNDMISELDVYVNELIESQEQRRAAEIKVLQLQINPHFIYNTLTSIKYLSFAGDKFAVDRMINSFIGLLKNTLNTSEQMVTINEEVQCLKDYEIINSYKYGNQVTMKYHIADELLDYPIPKLILQPIVENSYFHGFVNKKEGQISVLIGKINDIIVIEIIDNGDGFDINDEIYKVTDIKLVKRIGIANIRERLKLIYGSKSDIEINSQIGFGTSVKLTIPYDIK